MTNPYALIEQGLAIFPCDPNDKRPVPSNPKQYPVNPKWEYEVARLSWSKEMTTDPARIAEWEATYPGCRWGLPTGHQNGIVVVDIDSEEADAWWDAQWLPDSFSVTTPRGGRHIYYSIDGLDVDVQTNKGKIHPGIDVRGEGGYVVAYSDNPMDGIIELPKSVAEILPERQEYTTVIPEGTEKVEHASEAEKRVLKSITDTLDALPVPWVPGAGYHNTQFLAACWLQRCANSPDYAITMEQAKALFMKHAPVRDKAHSGLREQRWNSALKSTVGQYAEPPGDVPVRLPAEDLLDRFAQANSRVDTLYWESKNVGQVKELIHELRMGGATEQEAYSISYEAKAMREIRKRDPRNSASTWGYVLREYEQAASAPGPVEEAWEPDIKAPSSVPVPILTSAERALIRNYPNFIDRYIAAARAMFAEPNLPLHYLNAWIALSAGVGDRGRVHLKGKSVPLSLWGMPTADSAAGKGDALNTLESAIGGMRRGGFSDVHLGYDASAQGLNNQLLERQGKTAMLLVDEASSMLRGFKDERSYHAHLKTLALKLYDGRASRSVRSGSTKDEAGETIDVTFLLWLQTTWDQLTSILDLSDVQSGLVGRFLVAIGDDAKITDDSLALQFADEYQVRIGRHPLLESLTRPIRDWSAAQGKKIASIDIATPAVGQRFVQARKDVLKLCEGHPLASYLRGVLLRVTENFFKAAALLALSEGRTRVEMEDLLIALKSGEYWVRDTMRLVDEISSSEYRRNVDYVVEMVRRGPRSDAQILASPRFKNLEKYKVSEIIARAESEGKIKREGQKWQISME